MGFLKKRASNKAFWLSLVSQLLITAQIVGKLCGYNLTADFSNQVILAVNAVLAVFSILGIVNDPTTSNAGYGDDKQ